jgi:hypothetical protein
MMRIIRNTECNEEEGKSMTQGPGRNINLKIALQNQPSQIEKTRLE